MGWLPVQGITSFAIPRNNSLTQPDGGGRSHELQSTPAQNFSSRVRRAASLALTTPRGGSSQTSMATTTFPGSCELAFFGYRGHGAPNAFGP